MVGSFAPSGGDEGCELGFVGVGGEFEADCQGGVFHVVAFCDDEVGEEGFGGVSWRGHFWDIRTR